MRNVIKRSLQWGGLAVVVVASSAYATAPTIDVSGVTETITAGLAAVTAVAGAKFGLNALRFVYRKVFGG